MSNLRLRNAELAQRADNVVMDARRAAYEGYAGKWKAYRSELAGLPVAVRRNGVFMALAFLYERAAGTKRNAGAAMDVLVDFHAIVTDAPVPADEAALSRWIEGYREAAGSVFDHVARLDPLVAAAVLQKAHAGYAASLAGRSPNAASPETTEPEAAPPEEAEG